MKQDIPDSNIAPKGILFSELVAPDSEQEAPHVYQSSSRMNLPEYVLDVGFDFEADDGAEEDVPFSGVQSGRSSMPTTVLKRPHVTIEDEDAPAEELPLFTSDSPTEVNSSLLDERPTTVEERLSVDSDNQSEVNTLVTSAFADNESWDIPTIVTQTPEFVPPTEDNAEIDSLFNGSPAGNEVDIMDGMIEELYVEDGLSDLPPDTGFGVGDVMPDELPSAPDDPVGYNLEADDGMVDILATLATEETTRPEEDRSLELPDALPAGRLPPAMASGVAQDDDDEMLQDGEVDDLFSALSQAALESTEPASRKKEERDSIPPPPDGSWGDGGLLPDAASASAKEVGERLADSDDYADLLKGAQPPVIPGDSIPPPPDGSWGDGGLLPDAGSASLDEVGEGLEEVDDDIDLLKAGQEPAVSAEADADWLTPTTGEEANAPSFTPVTLPEMLSDNEIDGTRLAATFAEEDSSEELRSSDDIASSASSGSDEESSQFPDIDLSAGVLPEVPTGMDLPESLLDNLDDDGGIESLLESFSSNDSHGVDTDAMTVIAPSDDFLPESGRRREKRDTVQLLESGLAGEDISASTGLVSQGAQGEKSPDDSSSDDLRSLFGEGADDGIGNLFEQPSDEMNLLDGEVPEDFFGTDKSFDVAATGQVLEAGPADIISRFRAGTTILAKSIFDRADRMLDLKSNWGLYCDIAAAIITTVSLAIIASWLIWY